MLELLENPLAIHCQTATNCAIFGRAKGDDPLHHRDLVSAAMDVDGECRLPYLVTTQVERAQSAFEPQTCSDEALLWEGRVPD